MYIKQVFCAHNMYFPSNYFLNKIPSFVYMLIILTKVYFNYKRVITKK